MSDQPAKVYLVGAGPGDPGLLTLRAAELLSTADLVLYDGLVNPLLLRLTTGVCERTARTRQGDGSVVPQHEINQRLIEESRAGRTVVRLKGGDPFIFGRGSEELAALEAAGVPVEVVPGITAATAAGEYAGFSFTHRQFASAVAFVTGHEDPTRPASRLDYRALAAFPGTLVFYMGLGRIQSICAELMSHGKPEQTPAAVVCSASLPSQQVVAATLSDLPERAAAAGVHAPSLIIVGECVRQRTGRSWFERGPLFGRTVGITRPDDQCDEVAAKILRLSGQPVLMPLIRITPATEYQCAALDAALQRLPDFGWLVFTSVNGVSSFFDRLWQTGRDQRSVAHMKFAAIGPSTAAALESRSLRPDIVPGEFRAEALAAEMAPYVSGCRILWAGASRGRDVLPQMLTESGAQVEKLVVYNNEDSAALDASVVDRIQSGRLDWIGISSPSIASRLAALADSERLDFAATKTKIASISPVTSRTARESGLTVAAEAVDYTWDGILQAIVRAEVTGAN
ncbi:MAG: uroporphyrinogen-III C-methyltransferase [Planctomycetaceae bacterium]